MQRVQIRDIAPQAQRRGVRLAAAGIIVLGVIGMAGPSWAGPLMGC